jgi:drug/metabolite transporter (DMT)-like permease
MRSRSPATNARLAARKKYTYATFFLIVSLVSFTVQTELAAYVQRDLGWDKAYCMLYLTHGSWSLLWPAQLLVLRLQKLDMPWPVFWRRHVWLLRTTAQMVQKRTLDVPPRSHAATRSAVAYMIRTTSLVTTALTVAGLSWYIAVNKTTPSDLTAIYNCSAFFAYAFSVPLLKERLRLDKSIAVAIAIAGVLVVAYGDSKGPTTPTAPPGGVVEGGVAGEVGSRAAPQDLDPATRFLGNVIIGIGSVLYGLYEVLYKRYACPPEGTSPGRGMIFANGFGTLIGIFTLLVLWIPLPVLHILGWETFELPTGYTAWLLFLSVVMNATFAGSFLVLISLTSPVLSSVASLLTIFIVAIVDWMWTGEPLSAAAIMGGCLIIVAFGMLSWSTWREMAEDEKRKDVDISADDDDSSDKDDD